MEVKFVILSNFLLFLLFSFKGSAQEKYLFYQENKDSIVTLSNNTNYYKIDNNLFDINRYHQIDTITSKQFDSLKFISVEELWKEANQLRKRTFEKIEAGDPIPIIDTYNLIFDEIYIIEELSNCQFKRVRVWWIDY